MRLKLALGSWTIAAFALVADGRPPRVRPVDAPQVRSEAVVPPLPSVVAECASPLRTEPTGELARVSCLEARRITAQVRGRLVGAPAAIDPTQFAKLWSGWFDPHGLWSAAPDAPTGRLAEAVAGHLLGELDASPSEQAPCTAAEALGRTARAWVEELRGVARSAAQAAPRVPARRAWELASEPAFEDDPVRRPARSLALDLGRRIAAFRDAFGALGGELAKIAESRFFPEMDDAAWTGVVLSAAVRAYVPSVDPHGMWAPAAEQTSIAFGDRDLTAPGLWAEMGRGALGPRIVAEPVPPLAVGDLVLSLGGVPTTGLSIEQLDELAALPEGEEPLRVSVLRRGEAAPRELEIAPEDAADALSIPELHVERIAYGSSSVLLVALTEVPEALGEALGRLIAHLEAPVAGVLLDLRGNGGGSTDGAAGAIGVFLPGVPSFPVRHRDGSLEVLRALAPAPQALHAGPVAVLVDGETASAAEMIAAAIQGYQRGPVLGQSTFGKGCIQEFFEDRTGVGVLRLTTMVFAAPDGSPLQGVGLTPDYALALHSVPEREALLPGAPLPWRGPDVRRSDLLGGPAWPAHRGRVGPCQDRTVCLALKRLGESRVASSGAVQPDGRSRRGALARSGAPPASSSGAR
jgi:carboxyl-terminal processing protease